MRHWKHVVPLVLALGLLAGCASGAEAPVQEEEIEEVILSPVERVEVVDAVDVVTLEEVDLTEEAVALAASPVALNDLILPEHPGSAAVSNAKATIDYSNTKDGYVMVKFTGQTDKRLKVKIVGPSGADKAYTYDLPKGEWTTFPLSDGNGEYTVKALEHIQDTRYAVVASAKCQVNLTDEFAPFIRPNQYVNYAPAANTVAKAQELAGELTDPLKKVEAVYDFVVKNLTYDREKAANVQSGYLPVLDEVLAAKKGICFDYAALMTGMLRSQGVPCKLVVGYAGTAYHAWVSVWTQETGWIEGLVYFDGNSWQRMDPTFASSGNQSQSIMDYIGDGKNYTAKYLY